MAAKILFITLSNIGDTVLTLPVLDALRDNFHGARFTVICGAGSSGLFEGDPAVCQVIVYKKHSGPGENIKLFNRLWREKFDVVVDLRNTLFGALLKARHKTSPFLRIPAGLKHMRQRHLYRIRGITGNTAALSRSLLTSPQEEERVRRLLGEGNIKEGDKLVVISAGSRSHTKRWPKERFVELIRMLDQRFGLKTVLVGDAEDSRINRYIAEESQGAALNLGGRTSLRELAVLLKRAACLISNDSAAAHIASYLDVPVAAIFGITDDAKYGPWSSGSVVVKKEISCRPCRKAQCRFGTLECMSLVKVEDAFRAVRRILFPEKGKGKRENGKEYKRILIARTDRIGDVLLSTPVIKAMREAFPQAYIAMMVSPYARDIVEGNPYLDKVIVLDKDGSHKHWSGSRRLIRELKKNKFDLAVILHPTKRVHALAFLSAIPKRVGYGHKMGFLLTDRVKHTKQLGEKHESEYNFDLLRYLGIEPQGSDLFMPLRTVSETRVAELLRAEGIVPADKLLAVNPGASCPSKVWPTGRFARTADALAQKYGLKVLVVAGPKEIRLAGELVKQMRTVAVNLAGRTSVSELASILRRCALFISNDSGPVHIAAAVGTPVISIFGRNQPGLSPRRWGPLAKKARVLHKAGCVECLAHNCRKEFACLKAISVEDVVSCADAILHA